MGKMKFLQKNTGMAAVNKPQSEPESDRSYQERRSKFDSRINPA